MELTITEMYSQSDEVKKLFQALATFGEKITPIELDGLAEYNTANGKKQFKFPTMNMAISHTKALREELGLLVHQMNVGSAGVMTTVVHTESGEFIRAYSCMSLPMRDPQSIGSAITYLRRYAYLTALGCVPNNDTDGAQVEGEETTSVMVSDTKLAKIEVKLKEAQDLGINIMGYEKTYQERKISGDMTEDLYKNFMEMWDGDIKKAKSS